MIGPRWRVDGERRLVLDGDLRSAVARLRGGAADPAAACTLDAQLRPRLLRYFRHPSGTPRQDAEDLVQKTLLLVFQHVSALQDEERFVGWLYAIARRVRLTEVGRRPAERVSLADHDPPDPSASGPPEVRLEREERRAALRRALGRLPPRQRQCLVLRMRDELSYEEIAGALDLNVLTVRNHIAEAKKSLRRMVGAGSEGAGT